MKTKQQLLTCAKTGFVFNYEGCSLILVIDSFSPKPSFIPEENYLLVEEWFFAILNPRGNMVVFWHQDQYTIYGDFLWQMAGQGA